jgi:N,N'-diacetyllegionaminate synthase
MIKIGNKNIGKNASCLISFEPGATYSDLKEAKLMIDAAANAGADAIKFQTFLIGDAERMMGKKNIEIDFSTSTGKKKEFVIDALKRRELSKEDWIEIVNYSHKLGLLFITAPYFLDTVDFLEELKVDAIKVSKGDINNVILIDRIAKTNLPVILDGREKFADVEVAIEICKNNNNSQIIIMHCPSGYPTENAGIHLSAIPVISEKYNCPVGFADHSPGDLMNFAAVALGAAMLEKTITIDKTTEKIEHFMSLELKELKEFVKNIRSIEQAVGDPSILAKSRVEENARRSIVAKRDIKKGEIITDAIVDFKRPGNMGISCADGFVVLTKKASTNILKNTFLQWSMLE